MDTFDFRMAWHKFSNFLCRFAHNDEDKTGTTEVDFPECEQLQIDFQPSSVSCQ